MQGLRKRTLGFPFEQVGKDLEDVWGEQESGGGEALKGQKLRGGVAGPRAPPRETGGPAALDRKGGCCILCFLFHDDQNMVLR